MEIIEIYKFRAFEQYKQLESVLTYIFKYTEQTNEKSGKNKSK